jgi:hypothetical protein
VGTLVNGFSNGRVWNTPLNPFGDFMKFFILLIIFGLYGTLMVVMYESNKTQDNLRKNIHSLEQVIDNQDKLLNNCNIY